MTIRNIIIETIGNIGKDQAVRLPPLHDGVQLMEAGLDSLFFAILVSRLEDAIGRDPFATAKASEFPHTLGELVAFYERVDA